jgi:RHS repeat-associated protein
VPSLNKFTNKERDSESGLDNFGARYHSSTMGRFISPDAKLMSSRHLAFPQKWNKYAYVQNNPLGRIDPDGLDDYVVFRPATTTSKQTNGFYVTCSKCPTDYGVGYLHSITTCYCQRRVLLSH